MTAAVALTIAAAVALAIWAIIHVARKRPTSGRQVIGAAVVEGGIVLTGVLTVVAQAGGHVTGDPIVLWGYLLTALVVPLVAVAWAFVDRTPTSAIAMAVCSVTVVVMMWRVLEVAALR